MDRHDFILGGIALVAGVLLGLLFAPRGASVEDLTAALDSRLASVEGAAAAAGDGVSALQTQVEDNFTGLQTHVTDSITSLGDRIGAVEQSVSGSADTIANRVSSEFSGRFDSLGSAISEQSSTLSERLAGLRNSISGGGSDTAAAGDGSAAPGPIEGGTGIGQTAALADGAVRAFVSRIDAENDSVRLSINGASSVVEVGDTVDVTVGDQNCEVTVDAIGDNVVALRGTCG